jgi:hypothetical protein
VPDEPAWTLWAPPLDPPMAAGLPYEVAEGIIAALWDEDQHLALAELWDAYAGILPPEPSVRSVSTGAQSVQYAAGGGGVFGLAVARAAWFRSLAGSGGTVPLVVEHRVLHAARQALP